MGYKSKVNPCKYIIEFTSVAVCPVDDFEIRKICNFEMPVPHTFYK